MNGASRESALMTHGDIFSFSSNKVAMIDRHILYEEIKHEVNNSHY